MSHLTIRQLLIDLDTPFERRWNGGDAFRTAFFDALSMSFPVGEQLFIDSVRRGLAQLPADRREAFAAEVRAFVGQEATHRRVHQRFNDQLAAHGLHNTWHGRAARRIRRIETLPVVNAVAATAAIEHLTTILADYLLRHPAAVQGAEPRLQAVWFWHASEETEHRSTAFDLYTAMGGSYRRRRNWFRWISFIFSVDLTRQTLRNLWDLGALFELATWSSAARFMLGRDGLLRSLFAPWRAYLRAGYHPSQHDGTLAAQWLDAQRALWRVVGEC